MNARQMQYMMGRIWFGRQDILFSAAMLPFPVIAGFLFPCDAPDARWGGLVSLIFTGVPGTYAYEAVRRRLRLKRKNKVLEECESKYPLACAEEIIVEDKQGLEHLLERTGKKEKLEWGTALNAHEDKGRAVIDFIMDSNTAEEKKYILERRKKELDLDLKRAAEEGFNGCHHYHPIGKGKSFSVSAIDRTKDVNWINLLTFSMDYGPEIIGFNTRCTYIPKQRSNTLESKSVLVKATPEDIMKYLA